MQRFMNKLLPAVPTILLASLLALGAAPHAQAQAATERYIPIGQSPGMSQTYTYMGKIRSVNKKAQTLEVRDAGEKHTIKITPATKIWLDRSKRRRETLDGTFKDCRSGRRVEIKYTDAGRQVAEWVKIEKR